jgi:Zn-dependent protease
MFLKLILGDGMSFDIVGTLQTIVYSVIPMVLAITMQEVARAWVAKRLGDKYTISKGYNPLTYIDNVGTLILPLITIVTINGFFGWAKPAIVNYSNLKNKRDRIIVALTGCFASFLMTIAWSIFIMIVYYSGSYLKSKGFDLPLFKGLIEIGNLGISFNILLMSFNLLPILPLDGGKVVETLLPLRLAIEYKKIEPYGMYIVLFLAFTPIMGYYREIITSSVMSALNLINF